MSMPPPPPPSSQPEPTAWSQPPMAPPGAVPPPAAPTYGEVPVGKPPRPEVRKASLLMIVGAVVTLVASALPWLKAPKTSIGPFISDSGEMKYFTGGTLSGFDNFINKNDGQPELLASPGTLWVVFGVVVLGLGVALFFARRNLAVAIISIIGAALGLFMVLGSIGMATNTKDFLSDAGEGSSSLQFGLWLGLIGMLVGLAGSIAATAKRRKFR